MHGLNRVAALLVSALGAVGIAHAQNAQPTLISRDPHSTEEWQQLAAHLPDPVTASADKLEMAGDVLRARRFPQDAITFYNAALNNGGNRGLLLKKEGVMHLEMQHGLIARLCFQQAVRLNKRDAEGWNDLAAADFMLGNTWASIGEYKHAVKLKKASAVFHANLGLAYFEVRDAHAARAEWARAFALDPEIMHHSDSGGYNLQVLASSHYAEICFEMARVYASQGDANTTVLWLTKASERGLDVRSALKGDALLAPYLQDERVKVLLANNDHMRSKELTAKVKAPGLSDAPGR